jgi:hypothetical protein
MRLILLASLALGCSDPGPTTAGDPLDDPQVPPRGSQDLLDWIDAGHYLAWTCEPAMHPSRAGSGHGPNRICSNDALVASTGDGPYPIGAAAVKEVFDSDGAIRVYAMYRKIEATAGGDSWYWFEGDRDGNFANGPGDPTCTGCHSAAPRDFVYTVVTESLR